MTRKNHYPNILKTLSSRSEELNYKNVINLNKITLLYQEGISVIITLDGHYHSIDDEPAISHYYFDTNETFKAWYYKGVLHRDNGPAWIKPPKEKYYHFGKYQKNKQLYLKNII